MDGQADGSPPLRSLEPLTLLRRVVADVDASDASCTADSVPMHVVALCTVDSDEADDSDELDSSVDIGDSLLDIFAC